MLPSISERIPRVASFLANAGGKGIARSMASIYKTTNIR